jgi:hypothetical protein
MPVRPGEMSVVILTASPTPWRDWRKMLRYAAFRRLEMHDVVGEGWRGCMPRPFLCIDGGLVRIVIAGSATGAKVCCVTKNRTSPREEVAESKGSP